MRTVLAAALITLLVASTAAAQVPEKMNYQVMLTNDLDEPLADQSVTLVFRIYDAVSGGTLKWSETHNATTNSIGVVSVVLGSIGSMISQDFNQDLWLEIEVDSEILSPRRELVSAPYAFYAADSDGLGGQDADDYVMDLELSLDGTINDPDNPVDWTRLKNVPAGFADGVDAEGGGAGDGHSLDADDGNPVDAVYVDADGDFRIGGGASAGRLEMRPASSSVNHLVATTGAHGGEAYFNDETGSIHTSIQPDVHGTGGFFEVANGRGGSAFYVDGNHAAGSDGEVVISGSGSLTSFDTALSGDDAVALPNSAVSSPEILNEPGVCGGYASAPFELTAAPEPDVLLSSTITVPGPGYVLALATAEAEAYRVAGAAVASFGISSAPTFMDREVVYGETDGTSAGPLNPVVNLHLLYEVATAGSFTYYFQAGETSGNWYIFDRDFTLVYLPTAYGSVPTRTSSAAAGTDIEASAPGRPLTEADIAAEREESIAANNARIERELAEMEARIAEFRASMGNGE